MGKKDAEDLRAHLRAWAEQLNAVSEAPPVLVQEICAFLGVAISKKESVPKFKAYLSVDPSKDQTAVILLPNKAVGDFERFCVAHELAHYLILSAFSIVPEGESEYWIHEELCDDFARHLLLPKKYIEQVLDGATLGPEAYLALCSDVSRTARIPWTHAALRIAELRHDIAFLRCTQQATGDFRLVASSHPRRKLKGTKIKQETLLGSAFVSLLRDARREHRPVSCDLTSFFLESGLTNEFVIDGQFVAIASAEPSRFSDVKIALGGARFG